MTLPPPSRMAGTRRWSWRVPRPEPKRGRSAGAVAVRRPSGAPYRRTGSVRRAVSSRPPPRGRGTRGSVRRRRPPGGTRGPVRRAQRGDGDHDVPRAVRIDHRSPMVIGHGPRPQIDPGPLFLPGDRRLFLGDRRRRRNRGGQGRAEHDQGQQEERSPARSTGASHACPTFRCMGGADHGIRGRPRTFRPGRAPPEPFHPGVRNLWGVESSSPDPPPRPGGTTGRSTVRDTSAGDIASQRG